MHKSCAGFIVWLEDLEPNVVEAVKREIGIKDMPCPMIVAQAAPATPISR